MKQTYRFEKTDWALILGASSGFGAATAMELARHGMSIIGVHLDRAGSMPGVEKLIKDLEATGARVHFYNVNASAPEKRQEVINDVKKNLGENPKNTIRVLLHSLAFGSLRQFVGGDPKQWLTPAQIEMTMDVMANSLIYWTQIVIANDLMKKGGRIFGMTSSGGASAIPNYGAVSAAKCALESYIRQIALELGPKGITANAILAGVTDTPALRKIPGGLSMLQVAKARNPSLRNGTAEDVAKAIALLSHEDAFFVSGNVINVDAGEDVVEYIGQKNVLEM